MQAKPHHAKSLALSDCTSDEELMSSHLLPPESARDELEGYSRALLAGALYGLIDEWIRRGMQELPDNFGFRTIIQTYAGQEMQTP